MTRVTINPPSRKPQKGLVHAHDVTAVIPRMDSLFSGVRVPTYKANDSDDLHLMELISPSHELHRKLVEGRRPTTTQHPPHPMSLHASSIKSLDSTPRSKYKQAAASTLLPFSSNRLSARLFGGYDPGPPLPSSREPVCDRKKRRQSRSNRDTLGFEDIRIWNNCKPSKNNAIKPTLNNDPPHPGDSQPMAENIHQNTLPYSDICTSKPSKKHSKPTTAEQTHHNHNNNNNMPMPMPMPMPENMHQNTLLPNSDTRILNSKPSNKQTPLTLAEHIHQNIAEERHDPHPHPHPRGFESVRVANSEPSTHRKFNSEHEDTDPGSGFSSSRRSGAEEQRAWDLRLISRLWHQECKSAIPIQQRLAHLLNAKYKEAFEDGWMVSCEKCKHNDFKAEVAQVLKNLERAGAPQMATLNLKYELAVASVDEVLGKGMGEEYVKLEGWFLRPSSGVRVSTRDAGVLKAVAGRVQEESAELRNITAFMLDQLMSS